MNTKGIVKVGIPTIAFLGVLFLLLMESMRAGMIITLIYMPVLLVYVLIAFRAEMKSVETKLKPLLSSVAITNALLLIIQGTIKAMSYPMLGLAKFLGTFLCILSLIIGLIYIWVNRRSISMGVSYELIILIFPAIIYLWSLLPHSAPPQLYDEYVGLIIESTENLESINSGLSADSCQLENLEKIAKLKSAIEYVGTVPNNRSESFYDRFGKMEITHEREFIQSLDLDSKLKTRLLEVRWNGDAVFLLTQIETILRRKKCN